MTSNNAINYANQTSKASPTASDLIILSDQANSGKLAQSPFGNLPAPGSLITTDNSATLASFCASIPGTLSTTQSDTQTIGYAGILTSYVSFVPFFVGVPWTATKIQCIVKTGVAASTLTMGVYNSVNGSPSGAAITAASVASTANNTLVSATISASLTANTLYWAAIQGSSTSLAITMGLQNASAPNLFVYASSTGTWSMYSNIFANTYSAGTLPTVTPHGTLSGLNYLPIMRIQ